jgi:hypothetical protein
MSTFQVLLVTKIIIVFYKTNVLDQVVHNNKLLLW